MKLLRLSRHPIAGLFAFLFLLPAGSRAADFVVRLTGDSPTRPTVIAPGGTATFNVSTAPTFAGSYQWYFNDTALAHANDATLILAGLAAGQSGNYRLQCSPASGPSAWSNTLTLNIASPPPSPVDPSFTVAPIAGATSADPIAVASNGSILIWVTVPTADRSLAGHYARLNADGSLDSAFNYPDSAGTVLASFRDGGMLTTKPPYRLNADGSPAVFTFPATFDASRSFSVGIQSDGRFLLAQGTTLLRFNADGTPDPTFTYTPAPLVPITSIDAIDVDLKDRIIVHGSSPNNDRGRPDILYYAYIFRLTSAGTFDANFSPWTQTKYYMGYRYPSIGRFFPLVGGGYLVRQTSLGDYRFLRADDRGVSDPHWSGPTYLLNSWVVDPAGRVFCRGSAYNVTPTSLAFDAAYIAGQPDLAGSSYYALGALLLQPDGRLLVGGPFAAWDGHVTSHLVRLRSTDAPITPVVTISSPYSPPRGGFSYTLTSSGAGGSANYVYQWLALDGQRLPANSTSDTLVFPSFALDQLGRYQLRITGPTGATLSPVIEIGQMTESPPRLVNLSGRAIAGTGENILIAGFVKRGLSGTDLLLRGAGPALQPLGVAHFLADPVIDLRGPGGYPHMENDNWGDRGFSSSLAAFATRVGAFVLATGSLDAAMLDFYPTPGPYTLQLFDRTGGSGVGLVEIYEDSTGPTDLLVNLSLRAHTAPGEATAIAGFVINDPEGFGRAARVLLRVVGPTLATQGIQHPLADPILSLFNADGELLKRVDNWSDDSALAALEATTKQVGAFDLPANSKDAAVVLDLPAGVYTMSATGADGGSGVALLEIYLVR